MSAATLPLTGGRKKPAPRPRTEGVVKPARRTCFYARLYPSGAKRARYISTHQSDVLRAQELLPHIRAMAERTKHGRVKLPNPQQPELGI
jgi:hypothetical protein